MSVVFHSRHRIFDQVKFYISTWTGRILLVNFILFLLISFSSRSLFSPEGQVLVAWGAKDPVRIAQGEWWRFVSPIFLHFGILHFALNSLALKVVGSYLETMLGARWFLLIYLGSGVAGNVLSSLTNVSLGAGASGAIFGLIGVGMLLELMILYREKSKFYMAPFTSMAVLNIAFAIVFNFISHLSENSKVGIDNAAHIGGLLAGIILGTTMLLLKKNRLLSKNKLFGWSLTCFFVASLAFGAYIPLCTPRIYDELVKEADRSSNLSKAYYFYSQALKLDKTNPEIRFKHGRALVFLGDIHYALPDFLYCAHYQHLEPEFRKLYAELREAGHSEDATVLMSIIKRMQERAPKT